MKTPITILCVLFNTIFLNCILAQTPNTSRADLIPDFSASSQEIKVGECISFTDLSSGSPMFWQWTFQGAETPSSNIKNPKNICYYSEGTYDVILEIQNENNVKTKHIAGYIKVLPNKENAIANFEADITTVTVGSAVQFTDLSLNGPFNSYNWKFTGGNPSSSNLSTPPPVVYSQVGTYTVKLTVKGEDGKTGDKQKINYINVVQEVTEAPKANFIADRTFIAPGEFINFKDLSTKRPNSWEWEFEGATKPTSKLQNPTGILYSSEGTYRVRLKVKNAIGEDEIIKEKYIVVNTNDPCVEAPIADFSSSNRIINPGTKVYFEDKSENMPTSWNWTFEGGYPNNYNISNVSHGIEYNSTGFYKVSLTASNACGSNSISKEKFIIVLSSPGEEYCDTLKNYDKNENIYSPNLSPWGKIGGHNSQKTRVYAEKFDNLSVSYVDGIIFPVIKAKKAKPKSFVTFIFWKGNTEYPDDNNIIKEKKVLIADLNENFINSLVFDPPIEINGNFFVGYKINYVDVDNDGKSDDDFAISIVKERKGPDAKNTLYVKTGTNWSSCTEKFGIKTSSAIRVSACVFDDNSIEKINKENPINAIVYPNPASNEINVSLVGSDQENETIIRLINISGKVVYYKNFVSANKHFTINTEDLNSGLYFVDIFTNSTRITKKIMIAK